MPNCREHEDCDLVCAACGDYYCRGCAGSLVLTNQGLQEWKHIPRYQRRYETMRQAQEAMVLDDMPDDREQYFNERAEEMP